MARYTLLYRDAIDVELYKIMGERKVSKGRLLNDILESWFKAAKPDPPKCIVCGSDPKVRAHGWNRQPVYLCGIHEKLKNGFPGYGDFTPEKKEVEEDANDKTDNTN